MSSEVSVNPTKWSVPVLTRYNWVTYQARMTAVQAAKGHMPHIRGTARKPPYPPPYERINPHIPGFTQPTAGAAATTAAATTTTTQTGGADPNATPTPVSDKFSHLTDTEYTDLVEKMETKHRGKQLDAQELHCKEFTPC